jgi:predicted RNA-binding protein with RPS1 domain
MNHRRNPLSPRTVSDLKQDKRGVLHYSAIEKVIIDHINDEMDEVKDEVIESEDDDAVEGLLDWLRMRKKNDSKETNRGL